MDLVENSDLINVGRREVMTSCYSDANISFNIAPLAFSVFLYKKLH